MPPFQSTLPAREGYGPVGRHGDVAVISTNPPRVGRDWGGIPTGITQNVFQPTLPAWRGTITSLPSCGTRKHFNPPSPRGEGLAEGDVADSQIKISTHPPRAGGDYRAGQDRPDHLGISIHPPRVGRDCTAAKETGTYTYFNPPYPHGEGLAVIGIGIKVFKFQSTLPVRGGTPNLYLLNMSKSYFNPPSPRGEGHQHRRETVSAFRISIHPPRHGSCGGHHISIHLPRAGRDGAVPERVRSTLQFQSTLPARGGTSVLLLP